MTGTNPDSFRRTRILQSELPPGAVLIDQARERTSWEEGMFVTSAHFNRDQSYVIARHGDLGQAIGAGVVEGLEVTQPEDNPTSLVVAPGLGIGGGGESIVVHAPVTIALSDIALQKSLTQGAGLTGSLSLIGESRTGLFVLCASAVEYTSNPVGSYATTPDGQRKLRDSVVNEATLFTLVPFTLSATADTAEARRSMAARRVFLEKAFPEIPPSSLPLAIMELDGNVLVWLDMHLARRRAGAARADAFGIGFVDTPARAAHYEQYDALIQEMVSAGPNVGFAASGRFDILPPMGRMPSASVAPRAPAPGLAPVLSHNWLPAEMPVELTALPDDEIAQLLEESLSMPPIDLHASADALAQTPVTIIVTIPRQDWLEAPLEVVQQSLKLEAAAPLGSVPKTPMELIESLLKQGEDPDLVDPTDDAAWLALLAGTPALWYMRRRQFLRTDALTGEAYAFGSPPSSDEDGGDRPPTEPSPVEPSPVEPSPVEPSDTLPGADLRLAREIGEFFHKSIASVLSNLGLAEHASNIRAANTEEGQRAKADMNGAISNFVRLRSEVVVGDLIQRAATAGALTRDAVRRLVRLYEFRSLGTRFVPFEGLLTGGSVDLIIPQFPERNDVPRITAQFARTANGGTRPSAVEPFPVPTDMAQRVREFLGSIGISGEVAGGILIKGGGTLPLSNPRDFETRIEILKTAVEIGVPLLTRTRDPGSLEAQTRRNLLVRAETVPELTQKFASDDLRTLLDPLAEHMQIMERSFTGNATNAIRLITRSTRQILRA